MKKILFLLGGIVTLTACSEDVYTDVENTEPESMYSTNTFVDGDAGGYDDPFTGVKVPGSAYFSPWDIWYNRGADYVDYQPSYMFINGNSDPEANSFSPYDLEIIPYVGLAYYDGQNDGAYNDLRTGASYDLTLTNANGSLYPNLYGVNNQEIGNLVPMQGFIMPSNEGVFNGRFI